MKALKGFFTVLGGIIAAVCAVFMVIILIATGMHYLAPGKSLGSLININSEKKNETITKLTSQDQEEENLSQGNMGENVNTETTETGDGTFYIETMSGTSEDGSVPYVYAGDDTLLLQITWVTRGFDGSHLTFFYIDGSLYDKLQTNDGKGTVSLVDSALSIGRHKVKTIQYDTDTENGNIILCKQSEYEVKQK